VACHLAIIPAQSPAMNTDILQQYVSARNALLDEKAQTESRLQQLNQALTGTPVVQAVAPKPVEKVPRQTRSPISMRAAVVQVTTGHPMTKPEILAAIQNLGFRSASKKPRRRLDNLLYGKNPRFKRENGRFSPMGTATGAAEAKRTAKAVMPTVKRRVSAAGRARRSALTKARWAKIKKAGGRKLKAV